MSGPAPAPALARRETALLLIAAAGAWAATVAIARGMAGMTGTMGLGLALFVPMWTLMMAAMMLPSVTPLATLYARTTRTVRRSRSARRAPSRSRTSTGAQRWPGPP